jgi:peptidoglycan/xylan/chitin deacetylase (PgdA/CDA1 family)
MNRILRSLALIASAAALAVSSVPAAACSNPNALGVSRTLAVDARTMPLIGSHDYGVTLPLAPGEVVLTFDDGPMSPYTEHVLRALAAECARAVFFMVGRRARANPQLAWQVRAAGHTVGTHTQNHLLYRMPADLAAYEIDTGIHSIAGALGSHRAVAPFFRFPGLFRTPAGEHHLQMRGLMSWSVDADSYDWKRGSARHMLAHTLTELDKRRGGILLMHDVQPKTALVLPALLGELKVRGYRLVHVVPKSTPVSQPPLSTTVSPQHFEPEELASGATDLQTRIAKPRFPAAAVPTSAAIESPRTSPGGNGLFEAIFTASGHRWGR